MSFARFPPDLKAALVLAFALSPGPALGHASERALVMLLPTDIYTGAGVAVVVLTVLAAAVLTGRGARRVFATGRLRLSRPRGRVAVSLVSAVLLWLLVLAGLFGPRDPLANPLPLAVWTLFWVGFVSLQALLGNLWAWVNPWSGPLWLARRIAGGWRYATIAPGLAMSLGCAGFLGIAWVLLADPAPSDPARLATMVGSYWVAHFALALVFGPRWLWRGEALGLSLRAFATTAISAWRGRRLRLGLPGWRITRGAMPLGLSVMAVLWLGTGTFDGLNETFWWLNLWGINPLEYPGRSALVWQTTLGLLGFNLALALVLACVVRLGVGLSAVSLGWRAGLGHFAPTMLPIALGYHIGHYLPSFLVEGQYALVALSDPLMRGDDWLGLGQFYVTTGFFNARDTVRVIYLSQAGTVVAGHVLSILAAHAVAHRIAPERRRAVLLHAPLAVLMVGYTFFGLWLLASPRF